MSASIERSATKTLPMMPIRDVVIFPYMLTPFVVGRKSSLRALEESLAGDRKIFLATQRDAAIDEPSPDQIYGAGTIVHVIESLRLPDGNIKVLVEGEERARVVSVAVEQGFFQATVRTSNLALEPGPQLDALVMRVTTLCERYLALNRNLNYETMIAAIRVDEPGKLADTVAANLLLTLEEKQALLEIFDPLDRLTRVAAMLEDRVGNAPGTAIHQETDFPAAPERIYEILLDATEFAAFTKQPAEIQPRPGGKFKLFGGLIEGRIVELVKRRRIVQAWREASWPPGVYSMVRLELMAHGSGTRIVLDQTGLTEDRWDRWNADWQSRYWEPLRRYLGR